jgi:hypothetical protein
MKWARYSVTTKGSVSVVKQISKPRNFPVVRATYSDLFAEADVEPASKSRKKPRPKKKPR